MNHFRSLRDYERFIYTIRQAFPVIKMSTLVVARRGAGMVIMHGELIFDSRLRLVAWERITLEDESLHIETYGYEAWRNDEQIYWYDSQPHPNNPDLALNHPHHKHVPPDIKHNRIPAPELSFTRPNLPFLIAEIEQILLS